MKNQHLRLFFALECPPRLARAIAAWRDELQLPGRPVAPSNLHLTLAFLGNQPAILIPELKRLAATLQLPAFELHLDRLRRRRNGLLYLAPSQLPDGLPALVSALQRPLRELGIALDERPFHAHLTLMRHCSRRPPETSPSFAWPVRHFALYLSELDRGGPVYLRLQRWPLLQEDHPGQSPSDGTAPRETSPTGR